MFDVFGLICFITILVFLIIGAFKGFLALLLGLAKGLIAVIIASLLCQSLGGLFAKTHLGNTIASKIEEKLISTDSSFENIITDENKDTFIENSLDEKLKSLRLPSSVSKYVGNLVSKKVKVTNTDNMSIGLYIGKGVAMFIGVIIAFILVWIIAFIILIILQKLLKQINFIPFVGNLNRTLGAFFGILLALVFIAIGSFMIDILMSLPWGFAEVIKDSLKIGSNEFTFGKFMVEHNILKWIFNLIFK